MEHIKHIYEMEEWATSNKLSDQYVDKVGDFIKRYKIRNFHFTTEIDAMISDSDFSTEELDELFKRSYGLQHDNILRDLINRRKINRKFKNYNPGS